MLPSGLGPGVPTNCWKSSARCAPKAWPSSTSRTGGLTDGSRIKHEGQVTGTRAGAL